MKIIKTGIQLLLLCVFTIAASGQKKDSLATLREFLHISNGFKQMPLYLEVELRNSTNFIAREEDTVSATGKFYLLPNASYMQFGEMEQLVTDSMAILISNQVQRIVVNNNPKPILAQMQSLSGLLYKDASITTLGKKYRTEKTASLDAATITLNSRDVVYNTFFPKETIEMSYDPKTKYPDQIISTKRTLIPLSEEVYQKMLSEKEMEKALVSIEDKGHFLIREQTTVLVYKSIEHRPGLKMPVAVSDRIMRNKNGEYEPVKSYGDYAIVMQ